MILHRPLLGFLLLVMIFSPAITGARESATIFSEAELQAIKNKYGQIHINLINDYHKTLAEYRALPKDQQLLRVNSYLNSLLPGHDSMRHNQEEYWSTPKEFLAMGTGDCEDYVAIKYFTLKELGFAENKLYFAIVKEEGAMNLHMVLLYEQAPDKPPLVLDNLSFRVLDLPSRYDLTVLELFNTTGRYRYDESYRKISLAGQNAEFVKLLRRVHQGE